MATGVMRRLHTSLSLYKNSAFISFATLVTAVSGFIFWNLAARLYDSHIVGIATAIIGSLNTIFVFSMLGFNYSIIRYFPEHREKVIGSALPISLAFSSFSTAVYLFLIRDVTDLREILSPALFAIIFISAAAGSAYNLLYPYSISQRKAFHGTLMATIFSTRALFLFLFLDEGLFGILLAFCLALLLADIYSLTSIKNISFSIDKGYLKESFIFSVGNYIGDVSNRAPLFIMPMMILTLISSEYAAYFYIAYTISNIALFVPAAISMSFFVEGSHGLTDLKKTMKEAMFLSVTYITVVAVITVLFGKYILLLFGEKYVAGFRLLVLMILGGYFVVPFRFYTAELNIKKRVKAVTAISVIRASLFLFISFVLVLYSKKIESVGFAWIMANAIAAALAGAIELKRRGDGRSDDTKNKHKGSTR